MSLRDFIAKQFIDVIEWVEPEEGILAYRYPMQDREIQNGGSLTVRDSQMAVFVNEGKIADVFTPNRYTLTTQTLPILTYLMNWDKAFKSPFKSDVYFFSTRLQINQHWGTPNPITIRDKEFGMVRLRAFGIYAYHIVDPKIFYEKVSGTRDIYRVEDLEGQLRENIISQMTSVFANSQVPFLDMAANQVAMANTLRDQVGTMFAGLGLALDNFAVENISLPDELQKILDQRISMNMIGNLDQYTRFQAAQAIPVAAANPGGLAGVGVGAGVGIGMGQVMADALRPGQPQQTPQAAPPPAAGGAPAAAGADTKFCMECGNSMPRAGKFCPTCGKPQG